MGAAAFRRRSAFCNSCSTCSSEMSSPTQSRSYGNPIVAAMRLFLVGAYVQANFNYEESFVVQKKRVLGTLIAGVYHITRLN